MTAFGQPAVPQREQTMEEILSSIRKIIESNEAMAIQAEAAAANVAPQPVVQSLSAAVAAEIPAASPPVVPASVPVSAPFIHAASTQVAAAAERLVSEAPERRVAAAFDDLNSAFTRAKQLPMENIAETMLRPMMQDWLDNNLPGIVERLVREEIARIARGDI